MTRGIDVVLPDTSDPGWRLHLHRPPGEIIRVAEEQVLPEKVGDPKANAILASNGFNLTEEQAWWLRDQLTRVLMAIDEER